MEKSEELKEINPVATNQFQAWTGLKLIMLSIVINFYKTILESNDYFENIYFIDALSGSGICDLKDYPESFIGSPIIVSELAGNFFTKMYFIDQDDEYTDTLEKRLDYMVQNEEFELKEKNYEILNGDANKKNSTSSEKD